MSPLTLIRLVLTWFLEQTLRPFIWVLRKLGLLHEDLM